jgi:hypothetical protein
VAPYTLPAQRAVNGIDITWAVLVPTNPDGTGMTFVWPGIDRPGWWRRVAMTDKFRTMERDGFRVMLHPGNDTVLVERVPGGSTP